jgi:hypothetical protein
MYSELSSSQRAENPAAKLLRSEDAFDGELRAVGFFRRLHRELRDEQRHRSEPTGQGGEEHSND